MRRQSVLASSFVGSVAIAFITLMSGAAFGADMPTKAPQIGCIQAVDGLNAKVGGWGGSAATKTIYGGSGAVAIPLACEFGLQLDAAAASFDKRFLGALGGHAFWRDPVKGLLGVYGSYTYWNRAGGVRANHLGPEAEWYAGKWTLQGIAGVEWGNNTSETSGDVIETYEVKTRFFDQINLSYYMQDNFKTFVGHRYLGGKHALALGGEYGIPLKNGIMAAIFAEGRIGQDDFRGVWGGVRFYFGQKDKSLIRRHREDDPMDWDGGFGASNNGTSAPGCQAPKRIINGVCRLPVA